MALGAEHFSPSYSETMHAQNRSDVILMHAVAVQLDYLHEFDSG